MIKFMFYFFILAVCVISFVKNEKNCSPDDATKSYCSDNELCDDNGYCQCVPGYSSLNNECIKNSTDPSPRIQPDNPEVPQLEKPNHVAIAIIVPVILIIIIICSVVFLSKYNLVSWIRNKMNQRNTPYDEVMIGQDDDDPPLSGV